MQAETKKANDPNYKKKQILVVVLLAALLIAILTQPGSDDEAAQNVEITLASHAAPRVASDTAVLNVESLPQTVESLTQTAESLTQTAESLTQTAQPGEDSIDRLAEIRELSRLELDDIAKLELFAPEPQNKREKLPDEMPRVQAIYGTSSGHAALLGDSIIRGGQPLPQGGKVLHVTTEGVQIAR